VHNAVLWLAVKPEVSWLSENPITGTVPVSASQTVNIIFDAGITEVTQPGDYFAQLRVTSDTPYPAATIPVTMTVTPPDSYGELAGTVQSLATAMPARPCWKMQLYTLNPAWGIPGRWRQTPTAITRSGWTKPTA